MIESFLNFHFNFHYEPPRGRTSHYRRSFIAFSVSLWNDLAYPVFDVVGLAGFKSMEYFLWPKVLATFLSSIGFHFSSFILCVGIVGLGSSGS